MNKVFSCIACVAIALNLNVGSANAQQSWWNAFVEGAFNELGSKATQEILGEIFRKPETSSRPQSQISCIVTDPTGTPLNVRATPNDPVIVTKLSNGRQVILYNVAYDEQKRLWILVGDSIRPSGWVFGSYISCYQ